MRGTAAHSCGMSERRSGLPSARWGGGRIHHIMEEVKTIDIEELLDDILERSARIAAESRGIEKAGIVHSIRSVHPVIAMAAMPEEIRRTSKSDGFRYKLLGEGELPFGEASNG